MADGRGMTMMIRRLVRHLLPCAREEGAARERPNRTSRRLEHLRRR